MFPLLDFLPLRAGGTGFTANSCAPGVGGGRNEEEGDGKGDADAVPSKDIEIRDARHKKSSR